MTSASAPSTTKTKAGRGGAWRFALAGVVGAAIGVGTALLVVVGAPGDGSLAVGRWSTDLEIGSESADPWTRARVARVGLLALPREQAVYFDRSADEDGRPLDAACTYRIEGGDLAARWWSVTLYDGADRLARNGDDAASIDATRLGAGPWVAAIGPERPPETDAPWLSTREAGAFSLTLRLYHPRAIDAAALRALALPTVARVSCPGGAT